MFFSISFFLLTNFTNVKITSGDFGSAFTFGTIFQPFQPVYLQRCLINIVLFLLSFLVDPQKTLQLDHHKCFTLISSFKSAPN